MSLYNYLFGANENKEEILKMIDINDERVFDRFRDIEIIENGTIIRALTRTGGGNREDYQENWAKIKELPYYIQDYDDEFDETYAYIEFRVPGEHIERAKQLNNENPQNIETKFKNEITDMGKEGSEASKRANKIAEQIMDALTKAETEMFLNSVKSLHKAHARLTLTALIGTYVGSIAINTGFLLLASGCEEKIKPIIAILCGMFTIGTCGLQMGKRNKELYETHYRDAKDWVEDNKKK